MGKFYKYEFPDEIWANQYHDWVTKADIDECSRVPREGTYRRYFSGEAMAREALVRKSEIYGLIVLCSIFISIPLAALMSVVLEVIKVKF